MQVTSHLVISTIIIFSTDSSNSISCTRLSALPLAVDCSPDSSTYFVLTSLWLLQGFRQQRVQAGNILATISSKKRRIPVPSTAMLRKAFASKYQVASSNFHLARRPRRPIRPKNPKPLSSVGLEVGRGGQAVAHHKANNLRQHFFVIFNLVSRSAQTHLGLDTSPYSRRAESEKEACFGGVLSR